MPLHQTTVRLVFGLALALSTSSPAPTRGAGPADPLLRLVPPDAGLTVTVEDLRTHARAFFDSPIYQKLFGLPAVKEWLGSGRGGELRVAKTQIEAAFGSDIATIRDGLLGEAVVLALRIPPGGQPEDARGLFLIRVPDRPLLDRTVAALNAAQTKKGELARVSERRRGEARYYAREYQLGKQVDEFYAHLGDRVFAWSNSEDLIHNVLDRQARGENGLGGLDVVRRVRGRLPSRAVASVFVDPRLVERLAAAAPRPQKPEDERLMNLLGRYLAAVRYAGAAVEWRNGLVLHTEEVVDPQKLGPTLRGLVEQTDRAGTPPTACTPPGALVFATAKVDFGVLLDAFSDLIPEKDQAKRENLFLSLNGLLLGLDLRKDVVPRLGPGVCAYIGRPEPGPGPAKLPLVVEAEIGRGPQEEKVAAALENALRTVLAVYALDEKHGQGRLRVQSHDVQGVKVTALSPETPLAYAVAEGRLILANSAAAVAQALTPRTAPTTDTPFERLRAAFFPKAESFAWADLAAIHAFADSRRSALAARMAIRQNRGEVEAARDLDQALALIALFDAAFFTSAIEPGFTGAHRSLGLVTAPTPHP